jgi:hypothetical protein
MPVGEAVDALLPLLPRPIPSLSWTLRVCAEGQLLLLPPPLPP